MSQFPDDGIMIDMRVREIHNDDRAFRCEMMVRADAADGGQLEPVSPIGFDALCRETPGRIRGRRDEGNEAAWDKIEWQPIKRGAPLRVVQRTSGVRTPRPRAGMHDDEDHGASRDRRAPQR